MPVGVVCRKIGMVEKTFYRYREKHAGLEAAEARRLRELEDENARLPKLLSEQVLHDDALGEVLAKKMVRPETRRDAVRHVQNAFGLSERRACRALRLCRATQRYATGKAPQDELLKTISVDNGPEFISNALDRWAHRHGVRLHFSRPDKPVDNCFIESFNGRLRDECLNTNCFYGLEHARLVMGEWLADYNDRRPHSSLDGLTPTEYKRKQLRISAVA